MTKEKGTKKKMTNAGVGIAFLKVAEVVYDQKDEIILQQFYRSSSECYCVREYNDELLVYDIKHLMILKDNKKGS